MKVFVSGSSELNDVYKAKSAIPGLLDQCLDDKDIILLSDSDGFSRLVQEYCVSKSYSRVLIYHLEETPRSNIGGFKTHQVQGSEEILARTMAMHCDVGVCYWNGESKGTKATMDRLDRMEKPCKVVVEEPREESKEEDKVMTDIKPSAKMKKGIRVIEQVLGIKYTGSSFEDAKKFLDENLPKLDGVDFRSTREPSDKQLKGIHFIESMLNIEFEGSTMKDASDFLDQYFEEAKSKSSYRREKRK